jgi:hypothetical protein
MELMRCFRNGFGTPVLDGATCLAIVPDERLFDPDAAFKPFDRGFNLEGHRLQTGDG